MAKLIGYSYSDSFYYQGNQNKMAASEFFEKVSIGHDKIIMKPISGGMGKGIKLFESSVPPSEIEGDYIYEEVIKQHPRINDIYSKSVNTMRIVIINYEDIKMILGGYMRFGRGGSFIDNGSAGGLSVNLDLDKGELQGNGWEELEFGNSSYESHPDSQIVFDGFSLPHHKEILDLCHRVMDVLPNKLLGLDIAISEDGPVIVEANSRPGLLTFDRFKGGLKKDKDFSRLLELVKK